MDTIRTHHKLTGLPRDYDALPFGRQVEYGNLIRAFKERATSLHIRAKGRSYAAALREFKALYQPLEYYCQTRQGPCWHDDSIEVWYTVR